LLRKILSKKLILFRAEGRAASTTLYQKRICKSMGIFLNSSIYPYAKRLMIQLDESLETPIINPNIEVRIIPKKEMISVLRSPTLNTSQCVLEAVKGMGVSVISNPDAEFRKSNPDLMPLASMLCAVFPATYMIKMTKPMMVSSWYRIPLTFSFLKNDTWQPFEVYVEIKIP